MSIFRASTTIAGSAVICSAVGAALGFCIGEFMPGAYRGMFPNGADPRFNPVEVGIGLGCAQGLLAGLLIGVTIMLAVTWYEVRMADIQSRSK